MTRPTLHILESRLSHPLNSRIVPFYDYGYTPPPDYVFAASDRYHGRNQTEHQQYFVHKDDLAIAQEYFAIEHKVIHYEPKPWE